MYSIGYYHSPYATFQRLHSETVPQPVRVNPNTKIVFDIINSKWSKIPSYITFEALNKLLTFKPEFVEYFKFDIIDESDLVSIFNEEIYRDMRVLGQICSSLYIKAQNKSHTDKTQSVEQSEMCRLFQQRIGGKRADVVIHLFISERNFSDCIDLKFCFNVAKWKEIVSLMEKHSQGICDAYESKQISQPILQTEQPTQRPVISFVNNKRNNNRVITKESLEKICPQSKKYRSVDDQFFQ
jgi:hypothetical protein